MQEISPLNRVRVGLVGLGGHGRTIQYACEQAPNIEVVSVYDTEPTEAEVAARRFDCRVALNYETLIREEDIEAIILITPNHMHRLQVESALEVGKNVFVEKPIANTVADGLSMIERAESRGLVLMIGHNMRFCRSTRKAKQWIRTGKLGDIVSTEIHFSSDRIMHLSVDSWRLQPELCPLLPVMQLGIHAFDLIHHLVGRIEEVMTMSRSQLGVDAVDNVSACYRLENGVLGTMVSNYNSPPLLEYRVSGTKGILRCTPESFWFQSLEGRDTVENDYAEFEFESYVLTMEAFGEAVRKPSAPETDGWVGLQALAVVEAMQFSAISHQPQVVQLFQSQSLHIEP